MLEKIERTSRLGQERWLTDLLVRITIAVLMACPRVTSPVSAKSFIASRRQRSHRKS